MDSNTSGSTIRRLFELLERLRKLKHGRRGSPVLTQLDTLTGHARGHLRRQLKGEIGMSAKALFGVFDLLGVEPEEMLSAARLGRTPLDLWLGEKAREDRHQLRRLRSAGDTPYPRNLDTALDDLDNCLKRGEFAATDLRPYLAALEVLELDGCEQAEARLFRTWDLLGAAFRASAQYSAAAHCYRQALSLTHKRPIARATILRRALYLATDECEFQDALYFVDQAQEIYRRTFRLPDLGRAWIDSGITLLYLGRLGEAETRFEAGLKLIDEDLYYQVAALQNIGLCHAYSNDVVEAKRSLQRCQELYKGTSAGPRLTVGLYWLSGEIALAENDYLTAKVLFEKVRAIYIANDQLLDCAAVCLRLAKTLLLLGDQEELMGVVREAMGLITPLSRYKLATAILADLQRSAMAGKLSSKLLDRLSFEFRKRARATR